MARIRKRRMLQSGRSADGVNAGCCIAAIGLEIAGPKRAQPQPLVTTVGISNAVMVLLNFGGMRAFPRRAYGYRCLFSNRSIALPLRLAPWLPLAIPIFHVPSAAS